MTVISHGPLSISPHAAAEQAQKPVPSGAQV
jgi:hypothetical protein